MLKKQHILLIVILVLLILIVECRKQSSGRGGYSSPKYVATRPPTVRTTRRTTRHPVTVTHKTVRTTRKRITYPITTTPHQTRSTRRRTSYPVTTTPIPFSSTKRSTIHPTPTKKNYDFDRLQANNSSRLGSSGSKRNTTSNVNAPLWQVTTQKSTNIDWNSPIPPTANGSNFGFIHPTTQRITTSKIGWVIPSTQRTNGSNVGWTHPTTDRITTSKIGWINPTTQRLNGSNIGWTYPTPDRINTSKIGWINPTTQRSNSSNFGWTNPTTQRTTTSKIGWVNQTTQRTTNSNVGWTHPTTQRTTTSKISWVNPTIQRTNSSWKPSTTPKNHSNTWTNPPPKNYTNLGWTVPKRNASNLQTVPKDLMPLSTPRPIIQTPTIDPQYVQHQVPQYYNQPSYRPNDGYWNQNHFSYPQQSPIINNYHTSNYGYTPQPPVTIINTNVNNIHYPSYSYSRRDYGDSDLGFYLGFKLGQLSRPSYHYYTSTYYNGREHVALYDHYEIHHHYHNNERIQKQATVVPNQVIQCPGDSYAFCPPNTTALCLTTGSVMCVVKAELTKPCVTDSSLNCLSSSLPCVDRSSMNCNGQNLKSVSIPCISTLNLQGSLANNNNSLTVVSNSQDVNSLCVTIAALPAENNKTKKGWEDYRNRKTYHYITRDMGTTPLSFLLGQSLENLLDPGYKYMNYHQNGSYVEKYDHYYIYHHYLNSDLISKSMQIYSNSTKACLGDSGTFCPAQTISLCLNDGSVFCLVNRRDVKTCSASSQGCVEPLIPCNNSKIPECRSAENITVTIPCFSSINLHGNVSYVNSTFVLKNITKIYKTLQILPNVTETHFYCLTVLAVPAEKLLQNTVQRTASLLHNPTSKDAYNSLPKYTYDTKVFQKVTIGYYLASKLEYLHLPTIYYLNLEINNHTGFVQKYDHYDIYYYYLNHSHVIPREIDIMPQNILPCAGDTAMVCPPNTTALCLNSGTVLCVTDALQTDTCGDVKNLGKHCVKMTISCRTINAPRCSSPSHNRNVVLPCISFATVYGNVVNVRNRLLASGLGEKGTSTKTFHYSDLEVADYENLNKTQQFCVTVVLIPAERKITEGEIWLENIKNVFSKFLATAIRY